MTELAQKYGNLTFLRPLLLHMTRRDPELRPTAEEALTMLRDVACRPSGISFRWRLRHREDGLVRALALDIRCVLREVYFQLRHVLLGTNELTFGRPLP